MTTATMTFNSMTVEKIRGELRFCSFQNYETRNESIASIIQRANDQYRFADFEKVLINTDDFCIGNRHEGMRVLSFSTLNDDFGHTCPDWIFDSWRQVQIGHYEALTMAMAEAGERPAQMDVLGWRGAISHQNRNYLLLLSDKRKYDVIAFEWNRSNPNLLTNPNYVSLVDSVKRWRFLIDVEGRGYSARTKLLMFGRRVLFLQERTHREWFYPKMKPWVHYVPVAWNLKDLEEKVDAIRKDGAKEDLIRNAAFEFAMENLTRTKAYERWNELLGAK